MSYTWWINGQHQDMLSADSRGLAYGDGLFETMRVLHGEIPLLSYHLARLQKGAQKLGLSIDSDQLNSYIEQAISADSENNVLKLICARAEAAQGYAQKDSQVDILLRSSSLNRGNARVLGRVSGLAAKVCEIRLADQPALAGIKHLNRLEQVLAARELENNIDEGILLDNSDHLIEAISSNLILVSGKEWVFPDLSKSGVQGVMQSFLKDQAHEIGVEVRVDHVPRSQIKDFEEILLVNAVRGVRNLGKIEGEWVSRSHSTGDRVRAYLENSVHSGFHSF